MGEKFAIIARAAYVCNISFSTLKIDRQWWCVHVAACSSIFTYEYIEATIYCSYTRISEWILK